jgi:hypothetical protein
VEDCGLHRGRRRLRAGAAQEKFDCVAHALGEFVRSSEIYGPLTDDGVEKSLHEFGEVDYGKILGDLAVLLAFRDNFAQETNGCCFRPAQFRRADWIHRARQNYGLPKRAAYFGDVSQAFVKAAKALLGGGFGGQF